MLRRDKGISAWFKPVYDELATYIITVTCILLLLTHMDVRRMFGGVRAMDLIALVPIACLALFGAALSLFNVLVRRPKELWEKTAMAGLAMGANGTAGIASGMELLPQGLTPATIIPLWNIVTSVLLLYQMGVVSEEVITDEDATLKQVAAATVGLVAVFAICEWHRLTWPMTFSICVAYASFSGHLFRSADTASRP